MHNNIIYDYWFPGEYVFIWEVSYLFLLSPWREWQMNAQLSAILHCGMKGEHLI